MSNLLEEGLKKCGLPQENIKELAEKMDAYIKEIILFNSAYNLTNTSDYDQLVIRHILDSLSTYQIIKELIEKSGKNEITIGDIGSGGGLPGIPLAAAFPQVKFNLVERMSKRCAFLENCGAILNLQNLTVIESEAERIPEEAFDFITFRAFRPLDKKMIKTLLRITKSGGYLCAYKAKLENIKEEMSEISNIVPEYQVKELFVPGLEDSERNLVLIKK
ncbi:MAG: 16S rRNA (guanine(527)-N(7))-methyltransferase RsmG [Treponema sp.]|nr:16S rRNA (guanine(527)-N(7))-methyltransferase RsmG [Treponema sp.]